MDSDKILNIPDCRAKCADRFYECTGRKFSGCIEAYRICKEKCAIDPIG